MINKRQTEALYNKYLDLIIKFVGNDITYTNDLLKAGKKLFGNKFIGVFPADQIPNMKTSEMCISNLDTTRTNNKQHWVGLYKNKDKTYFYDSFGRNNINILPQLKKKGGQIIDTEDDPEQGIMEANCGARCLAALWMMYKFTPERVSKYL